MQDTHSGKLAPTDKKCVAVVAAVVLLSIIALVCAYMGYPLAGTNDAIYFMPSSGNLALHHTFINQLTKRFTTISDPTGQERPLFYPPLFPLLTSFFISPHASLSLPRQAFLALGAMNALTLALTAWALYAVATLHNKKLSWFAVIFICLASIITLRVSWGSGGRPETLARLLIAAGFAAMVYLKKTESQKEHRDDTETRGRVTRIGILSVLLGLMAATHPGGTLLFAAAIGIFYSFEERWRRALPDMALTYAFGVLTCVLVVQLSPFTMSEVISGTLRNAHASTQVMTGLWSGTHLKQVIIGDIMYPYKVLFFMVAALMLVFSIKLYRERRDKIASPILFACFSALFVCLLGYYVTESRNGYVTIFSTPMLAALLYCVIHISNARMIRYGVMAIFSLLAVVAAQPIILFPFFLKDGVKLDEARAAFEGFSSAHPTASYVVSFQLWTLSENYRAMETIGDFGSNDPLPPHTMLIWGQTQDDARAMVPLPEIRGCPLLSHNFVATVPKIFGIRVARVTPGYSFAAYACP